MEAAHRARRRRASPSATPLRWIVGLTLVCAAAAGAEPDAAPDATQAEIARLRERIDGLEAEVVDLADRAGTGSLVRAFDAIELNIGGFMTQTLSVVGGRDDVAVSPNQTLLEILVSARIHERVSFFTALGFLREADIDLSDPADPDFRPGAVRVPPIIAWTNYRHRDALQLRLGRIVTPAGLINIEHFPPVLLEINQPQFLRPFPGATLFPNFMNGGQLHGTLRSQQRPEEAFGYSVYAGVIDHAPEAIVAGARAEYAWLQHGVTLGANYLGGRRERGTGALGSFSIVSARSLQSNRYDMAGIDLLIERGSLLWKSEAFYSFEVGEDDRIGAYTQPAWRFDERWLVFYRFDFLDPGQDLPSAREHVVGVNYVPIPLVRLRAAAFYKEIESSPDAVLGQLSVTFSF